MFQRAYHALPYLFLVSACQTQSPPEASQKFDATFFSKVETFEWSTPEGIFRIQRTPQRPSYWGIPPWSLLTETSSSFVDPRNWLATFDALPNCVPALQKLAAAAPKQPMSHHWRFFLKSPHYKPSLPPADLELAWNPTIASSIPPECLLLSRIDRKWFEDHRPVFWSDRDVKKLEILRSGQKLSQRRIVKSLLEWSEAIPILPHQLRQLFEDVTLLPTGLSTRPPVLPSTTQTHVTASPLLIKIYDAKGESETLSFFFPRNEPVIHVSSSQRPGKIFQIPGESQESREFWKKLLHSSTL